MDGLDAVQIVRHHRLQQQRPRAPDRNPQPAPEILMADLVLYHASPSRSAVTLWML
jgi:hypothetical protein